MPWALALTPDGKTLLRHRRAQQSSSTGSTSPAASNRFVNDLQRARGRAGLERRHQGLLACSNDDRVVRVDPASLQVDATAMVPRKPWALAASSDGKLRVTHPPGPGMTLIDPSSFSVVTTLDRARRCPSRRQAPRPRAGARPLRRRQESGSQTTSGRPTLLLGTDTPQPDLDFGVHRVPRPLRAAPQDGTLVEQQPSGLDAQDVPGIDGALSHIVVCCARSRGRATASSCSCSTPTARTCSPWTRRESPKRPCSACCWKSPARGHRTRAG